MDDTPSRESYGRLAWEAQTLFERVEQVARSERTPPTQFETARAEEFLLQAGLSLDEAAYADLANELADLMLERTTRPGGFVFKSPRSSFWNPTLYRGVAGIGYALLRLDHGEALPNLLLFE